MVAHDEPTNRLRQWRQTFKRCMGARTDTIRKEIDEPLLIDIISAIEGVRSHSSNPVSITPLLVNLFDRWSSLGKVPLAINAGDTGFLLQDTGLQCAVGDALQTMRSAIVHGICKVGAALRWARACMHASPHSARAVTHGVPGAEADSHAHAHTLPRPCRPTCAHRAPSAARRRTRA